MIAAWPRLAESLDRHATVAVAVSGGVDSMTLASFAQRLMPTRVTMVHAVSPAVPPQATERVRALALKDGWQLTVLGSGEFDDPAYRSNPVNRCYYCKSHLYDRIRELTPGAIASGANLDDLGDYRPGLIAAAERAIVHPFVEAEMPKSAVRNLARSLGLDDLAELPAQPCLASRVHTGLYIEPDDLAFVNEVELALERLAPGAVLRCRMTSEGVLIETNHDDHAALDAAAASLCRDAGRAYRGVAGYRRGSMFVHHDQH